MIEGRVIDKKSKKKVIPEPTVSGFAVLTHSVRVRLFANRWTVAH